MILKCDIWLSVRAKSWVPAVYALSRLQKLNFHWLGSICVHVVSSPRISGAGWHWLGEMVSSYLAFGPHGPSLPWDHEPTDCTLPPPSGSVIIQSREGREGGQKAHLLLGGLEVLNSDSGYLISVWTWASDWTCLSLFLHLQNDLGNSYLVLSYLFRLVFAGIYIPIWISSPGFHVPEFCYGIHNPALYLIDVPYSFTIVLYTVPFLISWHLSVPTPDKT